MDTYEAPKEYSVVTQPPLIDATHVPTPSLDGKSWLVRGIVEGARHLTTEEARQWVQDNTPDMDD